jgi:hypothetical protein
MTFLGVCFFWLACLGFYFYGYYRGKRASGRYWDGYYEGKAGAYDEGYRDGVFDVEDGCTSESLGLNE